MNTYTYINTLLYILHSIYKYNNIIQCIIKILKNVLWIIKK